MKVSSHTVEQERKKPKKIDSNKIIQSQNCGTAKFPTQEHLAFVGVDTLIHFTTYIHIHFFVSVSLHMKIIM